MPEGREYYVLTATDLDEKQMWRVEHVLKAFNIPYHKELVIIPPTNWNPATGKFDL